MVLRFWVWIGEPTRIKLRNLIKNIDNTNNNSLLAFRGNQIEELQPLLVTAIKLLKPSVTKAILQLRPHKIYIDFAISILENSVSYRGAEYNAEYIVPLIPMLTSQEIKKILDISKSNGQIYAASKIAEILFLPLFKKTTNLLTETREDWDSFFNFLIKEDWTLNYDDSDLAKEINKHGFTQLNKHPKTNI